MIHYGLEKGNGKRWRWRCVNPRRNVAECENEIESEILKEILI